MSTMSISGAHHLRRLSPVTNPYLHTQRSPCDVRGVRAPGPCHGSGLSNTLILQPSGDLHETQPLETKLSPLPIPAFLFLFIHLSFFLFLLPFLSFFLQLVLRDVCTPRSEILSTSYVLWTSISSPIRWV